MVRKEWALHLGLNPQFPRDVGFAHPNGRIPFITEKANNMQEYVKLIGDYSPRCQSSFVRLYNDYQIQRGEVDKLFWDVDAEDLTTAFNDWKRLCQTFDSLQYRARHYFTGNKGFASYVDFEPLMADFEALKEFQKRVAALAGVTCDERVMGDRMRFCRLPYTPNFKSIRHGIGLLHCIPITPEMSLSQIIEMSKANQGVQVTVQPCLNIEKDLKALPAPKQTFTFSPAMASNGTTERISDEYRLKLVSLVDYLTADVAPRIQDGRHRVLNFLLVPALVQLGATDDDIHAICNEFVTRSGKKYSNGDYNMHVTNAIRRSRSGNWKAWKIETFRQRHPGVLP